MIKNPNCEKLAFLFYGTKYVLKHNKQIIRGLQMQNPNLTY